VLPHQEFTLGSSVFLGGIAGDYAQFVEQTALAFAATLGMQFLKSIKNDDSPHFHVSPTRTSFWAGSTDSKMRESASSP